jgi:CDP-diacylglycerol--glycerol-3-phosphate 3-phosphatidyltransferase
MTLYALKPAFQDLLRPLVRRLAEAGVSANQVTVGAALGSVGIGVLAAQDRVLLVLVPLWLAVRMALNAVDGMLAREHAQKSSLGAYLNELGDVVSDGALLLPFAMVPAIGPSATMAAIVMAILTEFAGVLGQAVGATRRYDGPMGKSDRALAFGALAAWIGLGLPQPPLLAALVWVLVGMMAVTVVNRVRAGLAEAPAQEPPR